MDSLSCAVLTCWFASPTHISQPPWRASPVHSSRHPSCLRNADLPCLAVHFPTLPICPLRRITAALPMKPTSRFRHLVLRPFYHLAKSHPQTDKVSSMKARCAHETNSALGGLGTCIALDMTSQYDCGSHVVALLAYLAQRVSQGESCLFIITRSRLSSIVLGLKPGF